MAEEVGRAEKFLTYLNDFVSNIRQDDPLPVRAPNYKVTENEIDGQILDIVHHYLNEKSCPVYVRSYVAHKVWETMRQPVVDSCDGEEGNECYGEADSDDSDAVDTGPVNKYEAVKLIKDVTNHANEVIREMSNSFTAERIESTPDYLPVSSFAIKNARRKMEDRHIILRDLNTLYNMDCEEPHAFYGVFDGHAGPDAAVYSTAHLHQFLIQNPLYQMDPAAALKHAFHFTDTNYLKKVKKERLKGGTTAVVALLRGKRLVVAWLGDSLAVLVRKRKPVKLVEPHKPDLESERERINKMGGFVLKLEGSWRVLGQLAVSRAIGDAEYKPYVSSECDIMSLEIKGDEDFLILATDGLWDAISYDEAVTFVYAYLTVNQGDCEGVGRCLVEQARKQGSLDNITAVVVFLRPINVLMDEEMERRAQGEVSESEMNSAAFMKKGAAPSTICEIFSGDVSTFNPESPSNKMGEESNPFSPSAGDINNGNGNLKGINVYAQGASQQFDLSAGLPENASADPTFEDVESALAELDSLPDGDDRDDSSPDNWTYETQNDHKVTVSENKVEEMKVVTEVSVSQTSQSIVDEVVESINGGESVSRSPPSSPRSVEGFVTSVELNTAQEAFTNLNAEQVVPAASGPFSVYVSSSPEPTSLDPLADIQQDQVSIQTSEGEKPVVEVASGGVEIVHAQSMVEVESPSASPPLQTLSPLPSEVTVVSTDSTMYNDIKSNDLMSTSMILDQPISDAPEQVEEMMQFMTSSTHVYSVEGQQTPEVVTIDNSVMSPEPPVEVMEEVKEVVEDVKEVVEDVKEVVEDVKEVVEDVEKIEEVVKEQVEEVKEEVREIVEEVKENVEETVEVCEFEIKEATPIEKIAAEKPAEVMDALVDQMELVNIENTPEMPSTPKQRQTPSPHPQTPVSNFTPSTPIAEPMINDRPVSPIHTPTTSAGHIPLSDVISEIVPLVEKKQAPVKPAPRTTLSSRTTTASKPAPAKTTAPRTTTTRVTPKPGTPRPSVRTTPGEAVRTTRTTPTTRTPISSRATTPSSRPTSATRTTTTRTSATTARTAPTTTRTTPSSLTSRPTASTRPARTTPTATKPTTTTKTPTSRPTSRPTSATTTPTATHRVPISRRTTTTTTTGDAKTTAKPAPKPATARVPLTRKPLYPGPNTTTTRTAKTTSDAKSATEKKDLKNSTNKLLSRTTTTTRTAATRGTTAPAATHRTTVTSKTTAGAPKTAGSTLKSTRTTTTTTRTAGPRTTTTTKAPLKKTAVKTSVIKTTEETKKDAILSPETNGEAKIAQEEVTVEVTTKNESEEVVVKEEVVIEESQEAIVMNGDAPH